MNKIQFLRTEGMVDRYLTLQEKVQSGYTSGTISDMAQLCYDMVRVISDLRVEYRKREMERRLRSIERNK